MGLKNAQLEAGHRINTRKSYRGWVVRYRLARKTGICRNLQGYLTWLSTDPKAKVNPKTVRQALNALKFYHEKVLGIEIPANSLTVPAINKNKNIPVWLTPEGDFIDSLVGGAMKLLDPHRVILPSGREYRFIFLTRSRRQQAASLVKFVQAMGGARGVTEFGIEQMKESFKLHQAVALNNIAAHGCPILRIRFEDLIERPEATTLEIAGFLNLDGAKAGVMRNVIRPRSAQCYKGLLELELLAEMERDEPLPPYDPLLCTCQHPPYIAPCSYCETGNYNPETV